MLNGMNSLLSIAAALVAVLVLIWLASRAARFGGMARRPAGVGTLSVQDVLMLDARRHLHLIKCGERRVLLLTGGAQDVVVGWTDAADPSP